MYHPYFRGKQYELITLRERAELVAGSGFCPIIEPVKDNLSSLKKATEELCDKNAAFVLIVNPKFGDLEYLCRLGLELEKPILPREANLDTCPLNTCASLLNIAASTVSFIKAPSARG